MKQEQPIECTLIESGQWRLLDARTGEFADPITIWTFETKFGKISVIGDSLEDALKAVLKFHEKRGGK